MLPPTRHRVVIALCFTVAAVAWWWAGWSAGLIGAQAGLTLTMTPSSLVVTLTALLPALVVAVMAALVAAWVGNPLAGPFVLGASLAVVAGASGPVDAFLQRADVPGAYGWLIGEAVLWHAGVLGVVAGGAWAWERLPRRSAAPPLKPGEPLPPLVAPLHEGLLAPPNLPSVLGLLLCAGLAAPIALVVLRSTAPAQVIAGLLIAFTAGGAVAHTTLSRARCTLLLLAAPLLVAVVGYAWVLLGFSTYEQVAAAWFNLDGSSPNAPRLPALALALPVYYASAGVAGCAMGIGLGQTIVRARHAPPVAAAAST